MYADSGSTLFFKLANCFQDLKLIEESGDIIWIVNMYVFWANPFIEKSSVRNGVSDTEEIEDGFNVMAYVSICFYTRGRNFFFVFCCVWKHIFCIFALFAYNTFLSAFGQNECHDPGVPVNGQRYGDQFQLGSSVAFRCDQGFIRTQVKHSKHLCVKTHWIFLNFEIFISKFFHVFRDRIRWRVSSRMAMWSGLQQFHAVKVTTTL